MIQFNKYLPSAHCAGTEEVCGPGLGKGKWPPWLGGWAAGLGASCSREAHPSPSVAREARLQARPGQGTLVLQACTFKSAWRGASAHPGLGSRVALLALLAATG